MGLLDMIAGSDLDPKDKAALNQGLLSMGLSMLAGKGNFGQVVGNAGLQGVQAYQGAQDRQRRDQMDALTLQQHQLALQQAKSQADAYQRQQDYLQGLQSPQMQASQQALSGGGGPTMANAQRIAPVDPQQQQVFEAVRAGVLPLRAYLDATRKDTSPLTVKADETLLDRRTMQPIYQGQGKPADVPSAIREYQFAVQQGYKGSFEQWQLAQRQASATTVSMGSPVAATTQDGTQVLVQPSNRPGAQPQIMRMPGTGQPLAPAKDPSKLTETEGNAAAFLLRATNALDNLAKVPTISTRDYAVSQLPVVGNYGLSPQGQQAVNAEKQFIAAVLRKESGAAIGADEYRTYGQQFFPRPGDTPQALAQKAQNRAVALQGMRLQAGPGAKQADAALPKAQASAPAAPAGGVRFLGFE